MARFSDNRGVFTGAIEAGGMARDPRSSAGEPPAVDDVLGTLHDADCRTIIRHLEEPMSAGEISETCDIPSSTTYRKLDRLTEADLLEESTAVRSDGHHTTLYDIDFERVVLELERDRSLAVEIERPAESADERLANMWREVRKET